MTSVQLTCLQQCLLFMIVTTTFGASIKPTRQDLENYLLKEMGYDKNFPPKKDNVTNVSVQLYITDFNSESEKEREIEFTLNLRMNWTDQRLDFSKNETEFDVLTFGDDIVDSIWIPDLYFLQERKSLLHGLFKNNQLVYIFKNGSVFYSGRFNIKSHCVMSFEKYPFDIQKCPIEIQSYALTTNLMLLHWNGDKAVEIKPSKDPLKAETSPQENSIETRYVYPEFGEYSTLKTEIIVPRPSGSYGTVVIMPPIILVLIALLSCFGDYKSRIGNATQTLTPLFLHWTALYSKISIDSTMFYLNVWMLGNLLTIFVVLTADIVIYILLKVMKCKDAKEKKKEESGTDQDNMEHTDSQRTQGNNGIDKTHVATNRRQDANVSAAGQEVLELNIKQETRGNIDSVASNHPQDANESAAGREITNRQETHGNNGSVASNRQQGVNSGGRYKEALDQEFVVSIIVHAVILALYGVFAGVLMENFWV